MRALLVLWVLLAGVSWAGDADPWLDAQLTASSGGLPTRAELRGRLLVVFYEDRDSTAQNQALKDELGRLREMRGWRTAVAVLAVANLRDWNWPPARDLARNAVRQQELRAGLPIYIDFQGALSAPPWRLPGRGSSVMLLDEAGSVRFVASGSLGKAERDRLYALLDEQLAAAASRAPLQAEHVTARGDGSEAAVERGGGRLPL